MKQPYSVYPEQIISLDISPSGVIQRFDLGKSGILPGQLQSVLAELANPSEAKITDDFRLDVWPRLGAACLSQLELKLGDHVSIVPTELAAVALKQDTFLNAA